MTTLAPPPAVTEFANAVREQLAGLDPEVLDELTGGLEADLTEALTDQVPDGAPLDRASVTSVFGSPADYATELRIAADLPLPDPTGRTRPRVRDMVGRVRDDARSSWQHALATRPWLRAVADFLRVLRPVWWVARAWLLFHLVTGSNEPFFGTGAQVFLLVAMTVISVLWSQKRFGQHKAVRWIGVVASIIAIGALAPMLGRLQALTHAGSSSQYDAAFWNGYRQGQSDASEAAAAAGLPENLTNLFVYGPDGEPIADAQIVDADGDPVVLTNTEIGASWAHWDGESWRDNGAPEAVLNDTPLNVYPWTYVPGDQLDVAPDGTVVIAGTDIPEPDWPVARLFPVEPSDTDPDAGTPEDSQTRPDDDPASSTDDADPDEAGTEASEDTTTEDDPSDTPDAEETSSTE